MIPETIGIIGLGLIGGTLAKTIHRIHPSVTIIACDTDTAALTQAKKEGVLSYGCTEIESCFRSCRYLFLCAPVKKNDSFLAKVKDYLGPDCILSDTGSVKSGIHKQIAALGLSSCFIGGHPMAGSEKSGYENATAYLFENAYYMITYGPGTDPKLLAEYQEFIRSLGCIPMVTTPQHHDYMTAAVSHLPHILASSLVNLVRTMDDAEENMKMIAAGGFKDITRIASSSPVMWQEICLSNREQILKLLNAYLTSLEQVKAEISGACGEDIFTFFRQARDYRDSLPIGRTGPIPAVYEVYCDLIDEAGGIATIATILASNNISIKNIGIIHNREFEEGVLRIEFYEESAQRQSVLLLQKYHYTIYER